MKRIHKNTLLIMLSSIIIITAGCAASRQNWQSDLDSAVKIMGHRNWIIIADSAYPQQTSPGLQTIATGRDHFDVLKTVLKAVDQARHVRAVVYLDSEIDHVPESEAHGITEYRMHLNNILRGRKIIKKPHGEHIETLNNTAQDFSVMVLKTDLTLPYTTVFIELDCGYWDPQAELNMRKAITNPE
jgi:hypothetical protein